MKRETLERANELVDIKETIEKIETVLYTPHPSIMDSHTAVCFIGLGEIIEGQLRGVICDFLKKKKEEINKEFDEL